MHLACLPGSAFLIADRETSYGKIGKKGAQYNRKRVGPNMFFYFGEKTGKHSSHPPQTMLANGCVLGVFRFGGQIDITLTVLAAPCNSTLSAGNPVVPDEKTFPEFKAAVIHKDLVACTAPGATGIPKGWIQLHGFEFSFSGFPV